MTYRSYAYASIVLVLGLTSCLEENPHLADDEETDAGLGSGEGQTSLPSMSGGEEETTHGTQDGTDDESATGGGNGSTSGNETGSQQSVCSTVGYDCVLTPHWNATQIADGVPEGWTEPLAIRFYKSDEEAPTCGAAFSDYDFGFTYGRELEFNDVACECSCSVPSNSCSNVTFTRFENSSCDSGTPVSTALNDDCFAITPPVDTSDRISLPPSSFISGGNCTGTGVFTEEPAFAFDEHLKGCSWNDGVEEEACVILSIVDGEGVCRPRADQATMCIAKVGAQTNECPSNYSESYLFYRPDAVTDDRRCGGCSCGSIEGTCGGILTFRDSNCEDIIDVETGTSCLQLPETSPNFRWVPNDDGLVCGGEASVPTLLNPVPNLNANEGITLCCVEPLPDPVQ